MAQHTLNTRIQLKYDSYENWKNNNPTLLAGEIAIVTLSTDENTNKVSESDKIQNPPTVLFKVGPGAFNDLKWASALAADVHDWAKLSWDKFVELADTVFVKETDLVATVNALEKEIADAEGRAATDAKSKADTAEANAKAYTDAEVEKITTGAGYATKKYVDNAIAKEVEDRNTAISTAVSDARTLISAEIDADVKVATDAIAAMETAYKAADTELSGRIKALEDVSHDFAGADAALKADLEGQIASAKSEALAADETFAISYANKTITLTGSKGTTSSFDASEFVKDGMIESVALSEDGKSLIITWNTDAGKDSTTIALTALVDVYTGVAGERVNVTVSSDNKISADLTDAVKNSLALANSALQPEALNGYYTKEEADAAFMDSTETGSAIDAKIAALKLGETYQPVGNYKTVQEAVEVKGTADKTLKVSQDTNGVITTEEVAIQIAESQVTGLTDRINAKTNDADLAAIAKTGNVNDLVQTAGDILVFNCGSSSSVF